MVEAGRKTGLCEDPKRMGKTVFLEHENAKNDPREPAVKKAHHKETVYTHPHDWISEVAGSLKRLHTL